MLSCPVVQLFLLAFPADKRLAIKAQTNCSEFTLVFCCTAQLALAILLLKVFHGSPLTPCSDHRPGRGSLKAFQRSPQTPFTSPQSSSHGL